MTLLAVGLGGALGAVLRYLVEVALGGRGARFPVGTLGVNLVGSAVLGLVAGWVTGAGGPEWVLALVGTGLCGALTTFSTFSWELLTLAGEQYWARATVYLLLSLAGGTGAFVLGWSVWGTGA